MIHLDSSSSSDNQISRSRNWKKRDSWDCLGLPSSDSSESDSPKSLKCANPLSSLKKNLKGASDESDGRDVNKPREAKHMLSDSESESEDKLKSMIRSKKRSLSSDSEDSGKVKKYVKCKYSSSDSDDNRNAIKSKKRKSSPSDSEDNAKVEKANKDQNMNSKIKKTIDKSQSSSENEWADFWDKDSDKKASQDKNSILIK